MKLGDVLKKERKKKGLSVSEVARGFGISVEEYEALERNIAPRGWTEEEIRRKSASFTMHHIVADG